MASTPRTREELEIEARSLPRDERARLAQALIASLDAEEVFARLDRIVGE